MFFSSGKGNNYTYWKNDCNGFNYRVENYWHREA